MSRKDVIRSVHGFLNVNKPPGVVSRRVTDVILHAVNGAKPKPSLAVGHVGTLDPAAEGVLPVAIGSACKFIPYLKDDKEYRAVVKFGVATSTSDLQGDITSIRPVPQLDHHAAEVKLHSFVGERQQTPPSASALKVGGRRAYKLVREIGHEETQARLETAKKTRTVHVRDIQTNGWCSSGGCDFPELTATIQCGGGTYIRSLASDVGSALSMDGQSVPSTLAHLERTHSSGFSLKSSIRLKWLRTDPKTIIKKLLPCDYPLMHLPGVLLSHRRPGGVWHQGSSSTTGQGPEWRSLMITEPLHLAVLLRRWAMRAAPSWAVSTLDLRSPHASRIEGQEALRQALQGLQEGYQAGKGKQGEGGAGAEVDPTGVDKSHLLRAYVLTTRGALLACAVTFKAVQTAIPEAVLLDLIGTAKVGIGQVQKAAQEHDAPVLAFLGLGRVHTLLHVHNEPPSTPPPSLPPSGTSGSSSSIGGGSRTVSCPVAAELTMDRVVSTLEFDFPQEQRSGASAGESSASREGRAGDDSTAASPHGPWLEPTTTTSTSTRDVEGSPHTQRAEQQAVRASRAPLIARQGQTAPGTPGPKPKANQTVHGKSPGKDMGKDMGKDVGKGKGKMEETSSPRPAGGAETVAHA